MKETNEKQQLLNFTKFFDRSMTAGLGITIWVLLSPIPRSPAKTKNLKHLHKRLIMFSWIYPMVYLFKCTLDKRNSNSQVYHRFWSWFEDDTETINNKISSMLYNIYSMKTLLRKSKWLKWFISCRSSEQIYLQNNY